MGGEIPGDLAPGEARSRGGKIPGTPGAMPGSSTLIFVFFSVKSVCWFQNVSKKKLELKRGISSNAIARA